MLINKRKKSDEEKLSYNYDLLPSKAQQRNESGKIFSDHKLSTLFSPLTRPVKKERFLIKDQRDLLQIVVLFLTIPEIQNFSRVSLTFYQILFTHPPRNPLRKLYFPISKEIRTRNNTNIEIIVNILSLFYIRHPYINPPFGRVSDEDDIEDYNEQWLNNLTELYQKFPSYFSDLPPRLPIEEPQTYRTRLITEHALYEDFHVDFFSQFSAYPDQQKKLIELFLFRMGSTGADMAFVNLKQQNLVIDLALQGCYVALETLLNKGHILVHLQDMDPASYTISTILHEKLNKMNYIEQNTKKVLDIKSITPDSIAERLRIIQIIREITVQEMTFSEFNIEMEEENLEQPESPIFHF